MAEGVCDDLHLPHVLGLLVVLPQKLTVGFPSHKKRTVNNYVDRQKSLISPTSLSRDGRGLMTAKSHPK